MSGPFGSSQWMYSSASGFYPHSIAQSLRFEDGDSPRLTRTPSSAGNRKTWTWSAWIKRSNISINQHLFGCHSADSDTAQLHLKITSGNQLTFEGKNTVFKTTTQLLRDVSSFYNVVFVLDMTQATSSNRMKIYINGTQVTSFSTDNTPSQNTDLGINQASQHAIGMNDRNSSQFFDGYMSEVNFIDGTALGPDSFGETKDGIWVAKNVSGLTFGQNGFHLDFADSSAIGNDVSGQNNDFAVSGLAATDVVLTSPTNIFATMNPIHKGSGTTGSITYSEGNLASSFAGNHTTMQHAATMALPTTGKWYWEQTFTGALTNGSVAAMCGIWNDDSQDLGSNNRLTVTSDAVTFYSDNNKIYSSADGSIGNVSYTSSIAEQTGAVVSFAVDMDNTWVWVAVNGTYINGTPNFSDGTNRVDVVTDTNGRYTPFWAGDGGGTITWRVNFGQDSANVSSANSDSKGIGTFEYAVPSGYTSLCTANLPEPEIIDGSEYFNTVLWTGNGGTTTVSDVGFQANFTWIKARSAPRHHLLWNTVSGVSRRLQSSNTDPESFTDDKGITEWNSDGFVFKHQSTNEFNTLNQTMVAWNWKAGTAFSNDASATGVGTIDSSGSVSVKSGFSIISYVSNGTNTGTVAHGLATEPTVVIQKDRSASSDWLVYTDFVDGSDDYLLLNSSAAKGNAAGGATATVFNSWDRTSGNNMIAYCFADIEGYCKAGVYIGNANPDGPYVNLGFRPAFLLIKRSDSASHWVIIDTKRSPFNEITAWLAANLTNTESSVGTNNEFDILSNGFKNRNDAGADIMNQSGASYIYLAFAEQPFKYSNAR